VLWKCTGKFRIDKLVSIVFLCHPHSVIATCIISLSVYLFVCMSVANTVTLPITFELCYTRRSYLACVFLVSRTLQQYQQFRPCILCLWPWPLWGNICHGCCRL